MRRRSSTLSVCVVQHDCESVSYTHLDEQAAQVPAVFPAWDAAGTYEAGDRVRYADVLYKCLTGHTAQESWTPDVSPSLWAKVLIPDPSVIPEWEQPGSTNGYSKGDKVTHNGKTWELSLIHIYVGFYRQFPIKIIENINKENEF